MSRASDEEGDEGFVERRAGPIDRRSVVTLNLYLDRVLLEVDRRLAVLERHGDETRDRQAGLVTRDLYDARHADLQRQVDGKAGSDVTDRVLKRVEDLEKAAAQAAAVRDQRERSRTQLYTSAAAIAGVVSAASTLVFKALGVI